MENIQVAVRLRPLNKKEEDGGERIPWKLRSNMVEIEKTYTDAGPNKKTLKNQFFYDHCFSPSVNNEQIYQACAKRVIMACLQGYNGTIFMYGQTGSGKTYTMLGYKNHDGVYNKMLDEDVKARAIINPEPKQADPDVLDDEQLPEKYPEYMYETNKVDLSSNTGILIQSLKDIFNAIESVARANCRTRRRPTSSSAPTSRSTTTRSTTCCSSPDRCTSRST